MIEELNFFKILFLLPQARNWNGDSETGVIIGQLGAGAA